MATTACSYHGVHLPSINLKNQHHIHHSITSTIVIRKQGSFTQRCRKGIVKCGRDITDFIGGDLVKFDIGQWLSDVEEHKALAIYTPHEGGYEGRYLNRLRYQGYQFLDLTARGLGDPETTLTKVHPVCPVSLTATCKELVRYVIIEQAHMNDNIVSNVAGSRREATNSKVVLPT